MTSGACPDVLTSYVLQQLSLIPSVPSAAPLLAVLLGGPLAAGVPPHLGPMEAHGHGAVHPASSVVTFAVRRTGAC